MTPTKLVLLPGLDGTEVLFGPLLRALPAWLEPVVVRYPTDGGNGYADLQPLVDAAVGAEPECHVLGWSFGGALALRAARRHPDRVRGVVLASSFVLPPMPWLRWFGPLLGGSVVGAVRTLRRLPIWLGRAPDDPLRVAKARIWRQVPARTLAARVRAIRGLDARSDLRSCPAPLLYVAAADDGVVPEHNVAAVRAVRPDVRVVTVPGRHFAIWEQPAALAQAIRTFVGGPGARDTG